jgi:hypothetical protein
MSWLQYDMVQNLSKLRSNPLNCNLFLVVFLTHVHRLCGQKSLRPREMTLVGSAALLCCCLWLALGASESSPGEPGAQPSAGSVLVQDPGVGVRARARGLTDTDRETATPTANGELWGRS